uniref:TATA-box binding protein associated factor 2 n=1 Tax=Homo sapiens TaxID=9606 RepID=A0A8I5KU60_HUMAN
MPLTGVEPARMNRKKGDKGFESPRPYKLGICGTDYISHSCKLE